MKTVSIITLSITTLSKQQNAQINFYAEHYNGECRCADCHGIPVQVTSANTVGCTSYPLAVSGSIHWYGFIQTGYSLRKQEPLATTTLGDNFI
jgi:hypothetical protein